MAIFKSRRPIWQQHHVVDVRDASFAARTYREHLDLRAMLSRLTAGSRVRTACEIGAGFARMAVVLSEFADHVVGFEREAHFVDEARRLYPDIVFEQVEALTALPAVAASFDLVLTFTVLQHLDAEEVAACAQEIVRVLKPGGHLVTCEETDPLLRARDADGRTTTGRPVNAYQRLFAGLELVDTASRRIELTYPRTDVGTYMLFRKP